MKMPGDAPAYGNFGRSCDLNFELTTARCYKSEKPKKKDKKAKPKIEKPEVENSEAQVEEKAQRLMAKEKKKARKAEGAGEGRES